MKQRMKAALLGLSLAIGLATLTGPSWSQSWPTKPIRMVIPYTPGGFTDTMARSIGDALARSLGQPMVYDNKPGANSLIGAGMVAHAKPDGYTLGTVIAAHSVNPSLYQKMPFDAVKDFTPVTLIGVAPLILVANVDAPFNNVKELIAYAKANPGKLSYGSSGTGAAAHLSMEYFNSLTGTKMVHVPYKGTAPALTDLIGGQIQVLFDVVSSMGPHIKGKRVKAIAIASDQRVGEVAEVPTFEESGLPGFQSSTWGLLLAPAGTPKEIVDRIAAEAGKALRTQELRDKFDTLGTIPVGNSPQEAAAFLQAEVEKWGKVVRDANVKLDN
jgi:tripartite-type tricarboxylate transporter receptor subunit TctC